MTERLVVQTVRDLPAERFGALGAGLLARMETDPQAEPVLLVAELTGDAVLLGRHQRSRSALETARVREAGVGIGRRLGGGRAIRAGKGTIGVVLAVPRPGSLLPAPVGADKVINRYVRGLNAGLTALGAGSGAHYFGRDFVSAESRQLGVVSLDGTSSGAAVFEAVVAIDRPLSLPDGFSGYPEHEDPRVGGPEAAALSSLWSRAHSFEEIAQAIAGGYVRLHGCELLWSEAATAGVDLLPPVDEDEAGFEESGVADVAIGFAEALVRHDGSTVTEARLRGDFLAPAFAVRELERDLAGCPLEFEAIGARVDGAFRRPGAAILGLKGLRVLAEAVLAAAGKL